MTKYLDKSKNYLTEVIVKFYTKAREQTKKKAIINSQFE